MQPRSVLFDRRLSGKDKEVYSTIRSFRNEKTRKAVYASREKVAALLGYSISTVKRSIVALRKYGHLTWKRGGTGWANAYQFTEADGVMVEPITGSSTNQSEVMAEPLLGSGESHQSQPHNYYHKGGPLFFGKDKARVTADGDIELFIPHQRRWVLYGGGDDDKFRYGTFTGHFARKAALSDARTKKAEATPIDLGEYGKATLREDTTHID